MVYPVSDVLRDRYSYNSRRYVFTEKIEHAESKLKSKTEVRSRLLGDETKISIKDKIERIEKLTEEEFDKLIIMMKSLRRNLLEYSKFSYKCPSSGNVYYIKPKLCSNCGLTRVYSGTNSYQICHFIHEERSEELPVRIPTFHRTHNKR